MPKQTKQTSKQTSKYTVNYNTKWTHRYLQPSQYLYFKAKTPIQEIIPQLEQRINENQPKDLHENYQLPHLTAHFGRLYRNVTTSYLGWRVLYGKPGSLTDYDIITEQIGYREINRDIGALKKILNQRMLWKHDLYPAIKPVELNGAVNCAVIAKTLNHEFSQSNFHVLLKAWLPDFNQLHESVNLLAEQNLNLNVLTKQNNTSWQDLLNNLKTVHDAYQKLNAYKSKNFTIYATNIHDVLTLRHPQSKGWRVEFLNKNI